LKFYAFGYEFFLIALQHELIIQIRLLPPKQYTGINQKLKILIMTEFWETGAHKNAYDP
jgi:uncharacterized membrane protein